MVQNFVYLESNISSNVSIDAETDSRIGKAITTFARHSARVGENSKIKYPQKWPYIRPMCDEKAKAES